MDVEEVKEKMKRLADSYNEDPNDVLATFKELLNEEREKGRPKPHERAWRRTLIHYRKRSRSTSQEIAGFFVGATDPFNSLKNRRERQKKKAKRMGKDKAIKRGLVSENGKLLYTSGPDQGEPMPKEKWVRVAYGYFSTGDGMEPMSTFLDNNAEDPVDAPEMPPLFEELKVQGYVGNSVRDRDGVKQFTVVNDRDEWEVGEEVEFKDVESFINLFDVGEAVDKLENFNDAEVTENDFVAVRGDVLSMNLVPNKDSGNRRLAIIDPFDVESPDVTVWVPSFRNDYEVNFPEESDIVVFGSIREGRDDYPPSINSVGFKANPDYIVDEDIEEIGDGEEIDDDWDFNNDGEDAETEETSDGAPNSFDELEQDLADVEF